jgi:preprotein translocase subunit YajC
MISHILFNVFSKYNIGSFGFRKILAISITILIFGLLYLTVQFTGMVIPNYTRNLIMLVTVDLAGFLFLMWKRPKEQPKEEENEIEKVEEVEEVKKVASGEVEKKVIIIKPNIEKMEIIVEEEEASKVVIKKIVEENNEKDKL